MPTPWDGRNPLNGKRNPVALVAIAVHRKMPVHKGMTCPRSSAGSRRKPATIAMTLIAVCTVVRLDRSIMLARPRCQRLES